MYLSVIFFLKIDNFNAGTVVVKDDTPDGATYSTFVGGTDPPSYNFPPFL